MLKLKLFIIFFKVSIVLSNHNYQILGHLPFDHPNGSGIISVSLITYRQQVDLVIDHE